MAVIVSPPLNLAFTYYGIPWPDVDESKVADFGIHFDSLCEATADFGRAVDQLLTALSERSRSDAFDAVTEQWQTLCNRDVIPMIDGAGDVVRVVADLASKGITSYKLSLIALLGVNLSVDIAAIAVPGPGTAVAVARAATARIIVREAVLQLAEAFAGVMMGMINDKLDEVLIKPIEEMFRQVRQQIVVQIAHAVSTNTAVRGATMSTAGALYVDFADVIDAVTTLREASRSLSGALERCLGDVRSEDFTEPNHNAAPERDSTVRSAVKQAIEWALGAAVRLLTDIGESVVSDLGTLITDTYEKYVEADTALAADARQLREELLLRPAPMPYMIDRSTRPTPVVVWENPPEEIFTGQAVSDARFDIALIDLPDREEVVVTGPAVSDARNRISIIDLPDAPDPTVTGPAQARAGERIRTIVLPDLDATGRDGTRT